MVEARKVKGKAEVLTNKICRKSMNNIGLLLRFPPTQWSVKHHIMEQLITLNLAKTVGANNNLAPAL